MSSMVPTVIPTAMPTMIPTTMPIMMSTMMTSTLQDQQWSGVSGLSLCPPRVLAQLRGSMAPRVGEV